MKLTLVLWKLFEAFAPNFIRRLIWKYKYNWNVHETATISRWAIIDAIAVNLAPHSKIGALTIIKGLSRVSLGEKAIIGRLNWVSAYPFKLKKSFSHIVNRDPSLTVGDHAAITNRHLLDCTHSVDLGEFSTLAGFGTQILTHSIDIENNIQSCKPVSIGRYCFIGTNSVLLGGANVADYVVLGAGSVLSNNASESYSLYGGVPAKRIKEMSCFMKYFNRSEGAVK